VIAGGARCLAYLVRPANYLLTLPQGAGFYGRAVTKGGLFIGEVARRSGASRKALRIYEAAGILPPPQRTPSGYRLYTADALAVLSFLRQARRLGFTLSEIKRIIAIRRQGRTACSHVRDVWPANFMKWTSG
jgi:hypothetical protein